MQNYLQMVFGGVCGGGSDGFVMDLFNPCSVSHKTIVYDYGIFFFFGEESMSHFMGNLLNEMTSIATFLLFLEAHAQAK